MSQTAQGTLSTAAKFYMLNFFRLPERELYVVGVNAGNFNRTNDVPITFGGPTDSNGVTEINLTSSVSLIVDDNSDGANAVARIQILNAEAPDVVVNNSTKSFDDRVVQAEFIIVDGNGNPAPIEFPDGGSLVINSLKVKLADPS